MPQPTHPKIYHIVHVDRLASIMADGALWSDAAMSICLVLFVVGTIMGLCLFPTQSKAADFVASGSQELRSRVST